MSTVEQRMESEEQKWLRKHYHPAPSDGPAAKRTKFSDIQQQLTSKFPNKTFNSTNVSATIKSAFPHALSKPVGKLRQEYVFGLEKAAEADDSFTLDEKQLLDQIRVLEERVEQLEKEKSSSSSSQLSCEFLSLLKPEHAVYHGPDNIIHFKSFDVDTVIAEMHDFAPNLYGLLKSMGKGTSTNDGTVRRCESGHFPQHSVEVSIGQSSWSSAAHNSDAVSKINKQTSKKSHYNFYMYMYPAKIQLFPPGNHCTQPCWCLCILSDSLEISTAAYD